MVMRYFGAEGLRRRLADHMRLARLFAEWVDADPDFERTAPVPFSVVCFRALPRGSQESHADSATPVAGSAINTGYTEIDVFNERLMALVNASGEVFLSHTKLGGRITLRLAIGQLRTTEAHVARAWTLLKLHAAALDGRGVPA
jgi:aromatic-L-amino-acid/L-tryptophan decarboxylase